MSSEELRLRAAGLTWREVAGELIVLDLERSVYLAANGTGTALWEALAGGSTRDAMAELLVDRYGIALGDARADVDEFVGHLTALGLIES